MENGHWFRGFSHLKLWFSIAMLVHQRVYTYTYKYTIIICIYVWRVDWSKFYHPEMAPFLAKLKLLSFRGPMGATMSLAFRLSSVVTCHRKSFMRAMFLGTIAESFLWQILAYRAFCFVLLTAGCPLQNMQHHSHNNSHNRPSQNSRGTFAKISHWDIYWILQVHMCV